MEVTPALTNFKVNIRMLSEHPLLTPGQFTPAITVYNSLNHPIARPPPDPDGVRRRLPLREPRSDRNDHAWHADQNQPVTFTANATDPDGTIASYAWALGGDAVFDDGTGPTAQGTFAVGTHTVQARITDDDGTITTLSDTFTVTAARCRTRRRSPR